MESVGAFKCPKGHVLGLVVKNGSKVKHLLLYRQAVELDADPMEEVDIAAVLEGQATDIKCSVCGETRHWRQANESKKRGF